MELDLSDLTTGFIKGGDNKCKNSIFSIPPSGMENNRWV